MGFLDDITINDLNNDFPPQPIFQAKQVIELMCTDHFENPQSGNLLVKCKVLNTEHQGKDYTVFIKGHPEKMPEKKKKAAFLKAFWSEQELLSKQAQLSKIVGRKFSAVAQPPREYKGKIYQDIENFIDLGGGMQPQQQQPTGGVVY
jgi:hypothetical protein